MVMVAKRLLPRSTDLCTCLVHKAVRRSHAVEADIQMTRGIVDRHPLGIVMHEHTIVGKNGHV
ncbi:MAG: hypothetical protein QOI05_352 [Bradyrhizobium sp.]|jgi:DNA repair protein RadC|nr:hypothetical protein [Bradyrhizobium sp.]